MTNNSERSVALLIRPLIQFHTRSEAPFSDALSKHSTEVGEFVWRCKRANLNKINVKIAAFVWVKMYLPHTVRV